ncbi:MAG: hypothetical protein Q9167_001062 [Letrouitia subvulpina]
MYEKLARIEKQLFDIELDFLRRSYLATRPQFLERAETIAAKIPGFWPVVVDEAPEEIDRRIQPRDVAVLSSLRAVDVERFEVVDEGRGEPRSLKLTFTFEPNEWLEDERLEKKFWWRASGEGWSGLVSEPVGIRWKDRDLTEGLLGMAVRLWEKERELQASGSAISEDVKSTKEYKELVEKIERTPQDAISLFAFFGFRGHHVSAEESAAAAEKEKEGLLSLDPLKDSDEGIRQLPDTEIYPHGEELAIAIADDLYPGATQYFTKAQERDAAISEEELVSDSVSQDGDEESDAPKDNVDAPPKKRKRL